MMGLIERLLVELNLKRRQVVAKTASDEETYGAEAAARLNEWIEIVDSYSVVIYLKDGSKTSEVVCVFGCELNGTKESPHTTIRFGICRASVIEGIGNDEFRIQESIDLRDDDVLRFFRCDQPNDARELEHLKQQAEGADKQLSDRSVFGNRSGVDAAPYSFFWVSLPVRPEVETDGQAQPHRS